MKITLEINTNNVQDIMEAIETLKPLLPKEMESSNEDNFKDIKISDNKENLPGKGNELISKAVYESVKEELEKANALIADLKKDKDALNKEFNDALEKIKELEFKENIESIEIPDIIDNSSNEEKFDKSYIDSVKKDYESKIEDLSKKVEFHESRSNKNFEEVKRLRALIDNISLEKRNLEKKVNLLEKENEDLKELSVSGSSDELNNVMSENKELTQKIESLESLKDKLEKEVEFHKNRSKGNWDELKQLKVDHESLQKENKSNKEKIDELNEKIKSSSSDSVVEKLKLDFVQAKSDYESTISELRLSNDKLQNELNLYMSKFSDEDVRELKHLKRMKTVICASEKGATFWNGVESKIDQIQ